MATVGAAGSSTSMVTGSLVKLHPASSVRVTLYVPASETSMLVSVAPLLHAVSNPLLVVSVTLSPGHRMPGGPLWVISASMKQNGGRTMSSTQQASAPPEMMLSFS